jgi:hypothetical protein
MKRSPMRSHLKSLELSLRSRSLRSGLNCQRYPLSSKPRYFADSRHTYGDIGVHSSSYLDHVWCGDGWSLPSSSGDYYQDITSSRHSSLPLASRRPIQFSPKQSLEESLRKNTSRHMSDICWLPSRGVMMERLFRSCTLPFICYWMLVQDMLLENGSITLCKLHAWGGC